MRQHKLALCKEHFLAWIPEQTQRIIKKYHMFEPSARILVAVSGGKDSLSLWHVLHRLGYLADGLYIDLGIDCGVDYSNKSKRLTERFAAENNMQLTVASVAEVAGVNIPEAAKLTLRGKNKPCSLCGLTKRHIMNRAARDGGYDVLVTGHNLDDEVATLFGNILNWKVGYLARQDPVLQATSSGLMRKVKPFCRFYERETAAFALMKGIEYIHDECPFAKGAKSIYYKEYLNQLEADRPGAKLSFYLSFLKAKESGLFAEVNRDARAELNICETCGQPTSAPEQCAFCRTWNQVRSRDVAIAGE